LSDSPTSAPHEPLHVLVLGALGVVFGDIGTSPLYALRECFHGDFGVHPDAASVLGVLSLMFWALILIVTVEYLGFIFLADNNGEGGVIALTSLVRKAPLGSRRGKWLLVTVGLFAAAMLYGDGMITPAISVLSAVEGLNSATHELGHLVIPITLAILIGVFLIQRRGTAGIGALFGPIVLVWYGLLAVLGALQIARHPRILAAVLPWHGLGFLLRHGVHGFLVLGAVFLVVTGVEALYADLGHFGRRPIRLAWGCIALPALLLNYFGQGAHLLAHPEAADHIFYALVPTWGRIPMVVLATVATIIASQAVITGAFSLTRQAIQLGLFPRFRVIHTSARRIGQIYVPPVNWALMICTLALVVAFGQSSKLAAAYGVAVNLTMLVSSILFFVVARCVWRWRWWAALPAAAVFITVDLAFFTANLSKVMHGAWFPLVVAAVVFSLMATWRRGRELLGAQIRERLVSWDAFRARLAADPPPRVAGSAIFLTGNPDTVPVALLHNLEHNKVLHSRIALLHFVPRETPYVEEKDHVRVVAMGENMTRIIADYGYMEEPSVRQTLARARELGVDFDPTATSFFLGREKLSHGPGSPFGPVRHLLFGFLTLFSTDAATYFEIPLSQVIEVGISLEL